MSQANSRHDNKETALFYYSVELLYSSVSVIKKNVQIRLLFCSNITLFACLAHILAHIFKQYVFIYNITRKNAFRMRTDVITDVFGKHNAISGSVARV